MNTELVACPHCSKTHEHILTDQWQPIETAPKQQKIQIHYKNESGKGRTIFAEFIPKFTSLADDIDYDPDEVGDYDEKTGEYYWPEGWYELVDNHPDYVSLPVSAGIPTHWMPLPKAPDA